MNMMKTLRRITTLHYRGRHFYIVEAEPMKIVDTYKKYWGIETKYFDEEGKLTQEINGMSGHLSETIPECIDSIKTTIDIQAIVEETGCTIMEAIEKYYMAHT